ncbi:hypothetical protein CAJAP_08432 [Camponotus japonicus]
MIDRFTRWPEATPIADITADTIVDAFFRTWVARFGAPTIITTDRGSQFDSQFFSALASLIGCRRHRTIAYHPQSNERWHRSLKAAIKYHETSDWVKVLPVVMLGLRTALKEDIGTSAAELVYGAQLKLPGEYSIQEEPSQDPFPFLEHLRQAMRSIRPQQTAHHTRPRIFVHKDLHTCTHVFLRVDSVRRPLDQPYEGFYAVLERISDLCFRIDVRGQPTDVSVDRLKPAFLEIDPDNVEHPQHRTAAEIRHQHRPTSTATGLPDYSRGSVSLPYQVTEGGVLWRWPIPEHLGLDTHGTALTSAATPLGMPPFSVCSGCRPAPLLRPWIFDVPVDPYKVLSRLKHSSHAFEWIVLMYSFVLNN